MKWMKETRKETRKETATASAQALLPTIEDTALLEAISGGPETVHLYRTMGIRLFPKGFITAPEDPFTITNGGVTHEDS